jgi:hypothetical protein
MWKRFIVLGIGGLVIVMSGAVGTSSGNQEGATVLIVNPDLGKARPESSELTPEIIQNATPAPFPKLPGAGVPENAQTVDAGETTSVEKAPTVLVEPGLPDPEADSAASSILSDKLKALTGQNSGPVSEADVSPLAAGDACDPSWGPLDWCQHPRTSYPGGYWPTIQTSYPWKAVGKLMFQDSEDDWHFCTAQVISGPPKNLIVTAGHCVFYPDNQTYYKNWIFIPAEKDGAKGEKQGPFGQFKYKSVRVLSRWMEGGNSRDDVALISLQNDSRGKPVSYYTGWLGVQLNLPYVQNLTLMGYSTSTVPEGKWSTINNGQSFYFENQDICYGFTGEDAIFIGSDFGRGSSGGAWINQIQPFDNTTSGNYVVSVVSGPLECKSGTVITSPASIIKGPRFSDANIGLLCTAYDGCTTP